MDRTISVDLALESILPSVSKPTRYLGNEVHAVHKDWAGAEIKLALLFPEVYEIGMSTLGMKILYEIVNRRPDALAERAYQPWLDMEEAMRGRGVPLFALESKRPVRDFDLVGFSLQAEQTYPGVLNCLDLAGIPILAAERGERDPLVLGGGPCTANPEPLADFFDFFLIGDGEEAIGGILDIVKAARRSGLARRETLRALCAVRGVYVPAFYDVDYDERGRVRSVRPNDPAAPEKVERTWIDDLESAPYPKRPIVPLQEVTQDRLAIEVLRGCTQGCRYCQAGYFYRPVRERSPERVREIAEEGVRAGGFDEVSLVSLSTADHSAVNRLAQTVNDALKDRKVAISLPSLRIENFSVLLAETVREVKKTGFTFAPEAGSMRLRRAINKPIPEETILQTAEAAYSRGWNLIKVYYMVGLPGETMEDVEAIAELSEKILATGRRAGSGRRIHVSVGPFVPKPFTPFQWRPMDDLESLRAKITHLKRRCNHGGSKLKWHEPECSVVEALLARGDRSVGRAVRRAWELGARFDGWSEHFSLSRWVQACEETGIDFAFHLRERDTGETLPWDHLDIGISKKFLVREYERSLEGKTTEDCRWGRCVVCGIPGSGKDIVLTAGGDTIPRGEALEAEAPADATGVPPGPDVPAGAPSGPPVPAGAASGPPVRAARGARARQAPRDPNATSQRLPGERIKVRLRYEKTDEARYLSHLDVVRALERALRAAVVPVAYTEGFSPRVRLSFGPPLSVGVMSFCEIADIEMRERPGLRRLAAGLNECLPGGLRIREAEFVPFLTPSASAVASEACYEATPSAALALERKFVSTSLGAVLEAATFQVTRNSPKGVKTADLKLSLTGIRMVEESGVLGIHFSLRTGEGAVSPRLVLQAILGLSEEQSHHLRITRTELRPLAGTFHS